MDRFIDNYDCSSVQTLHNLKSNMDRFIDQSAEYYHNRKRNLKSNMDRFIVWSVCVVMSIPNI